MTDALLLQIEVQRFLAHEARLLDERSLHEWLDLFTEDASYAMATRETVQAREEGAILPGGVPEVPLFEDDRAFLGLRVKRLETRLAHAEQPPSMTRHLVTNILVEDIGSEDEVSVSSNVLVFQSRPDISQHLLIGRREDRLRRVDGQWRIARRRVVLDSSVLPRTVTVFF